MTKGYWKFQKKMILIFTGIIQVFFTIDAAMKKNSVLEMEYFEFLIFWALSNTILLMILQFMTYMEEREKEKHEKS